MTRGLMKYVVVAIVGLCLALAGAPAFSADVTGKTSTQTLPAQTSTQTAPLPSNTTTVPLPSKVKTTIPTREYQQVNKPPIKTLDIPDYDLAGQLRISDIRNSDKCYIYFTVQLMNKGKQGYIKDDVQIRVILINARDNAQFAGIQYPWSGPTIVNDRWMNEGNSRIISFMPTLGGAPSTINDVKMIVDIDPNNAFGEDRRHRGNNRCVATW